MVKLSDSLTIRGNCIKNRIAMLPMVTFSLHGDDEKNYYGKQHLEHYIEVARGGAGLIILQSTNVIGASASQNMWTSGSMDTLGKIAFNVRQYGATVMMQLACGDKERDITALPAESIKRIQAELIAASLKAYALGFQGVEYHCAHGFTLSKFLDAADNKRTDAFGGSIENRARVVTEILAEVRQKTSSNFILSVRMGAYQPESHDGLAMAQHFEASGIDMLNISFGIKIPETAVPSYFPYSPVTYSAYMVKQVVDIPVIGLYEIRTAEQAHKLVENGYADIVGIGRAILADPHFASHILDNKPVDSCLACKPCKWYKDHTKCPARIKSQRQRSTPA